MTRSSEAEIGAQLSHLNCVLRVSNVNTGIFFFLKQVGSIWCWAEVSPGGGGGLHFFWEMYLNERYLTPLSGRLSYPSFKESRRFNGFICLYSTKRMCEWRGGQGAERGCGEERRACARQDCARRQGRPSESVTWARGLKSTLSLGAGCPAPPPRLMQKFYYWLLKQVAIS